MRNHPPDRRPQAGRDRSRPRDRRPSSGRESDGPTILYGWHTVAEALANPQRRIRHLWATENAARRLAEAGLGEAALGAGVVIETVRPDVIDRRLGPDAVHQGLLAEADPLPAPEVEDLAPEGIVLVLDQITDPHNVGAVLRSAAAFAVRAIVTTARHSPEATGVLAKTASGALEHVPMVTVRNLAQGIEVLRRTGFFAVGLDSEGSADLAVMDLRLPLALVIGAEGKGLRQLTRTTCDAVARLDMPGAIKSLNVSNATAVALHIATTRARA